MAEDDEPIDEHAPAAAPLHAAPVTVAAGVDGAAATGATEKVAPAASASAASAAAAAELAETAEIVASRILVSPDIATGAGKIVIALKPEILGGSTITIDVNGQDLSVSLAPTTVDAARLVEANLAQLQASLAERVSLYKVAVSIRKENVDETV